MDVAARRQDLLVVTENGYGKRTQISEYRKTARRHGRQDDQLTEKQGRPRRRARRARARGARVHQRRRDGPADLGRGISR
jgi:DNA gyrase/topoisomerase IV subunit A